MATKASDRKNFLCSVDTAYTTLLTVLERDKRFTVKESDSTSKTIKAATGVSMRSFGEAISIKVFPANDNTCDVEILSSFPIPALTDGGKNKANVEAIFQIFVKEIGANDVVVDGEFRSIGGKTWTATDNGIIYGKETIPYKELTNLKLLSSPTTPLTNGVAQAGCITGKVVTLAFKFSDRARAQRTFAFIQEKIDEASGNVKGYKYKLTAHTGTTLEVYDTYYILNFMPLGSIAGMMRGGGTGGKRINFVDLTSIQFKEPSGATVGFIQFSYPGSTESKGGVTAAVNDENSIPFSTPDLEKAREIVDFIEKRRVELRNAPGGTVVQQASAADELKKFKDLLDMGVITQEEFDAKKKQLLGL